MLDTKNTPLYFDNPKEAVIVTTELLEKRNWSRLARYYDLSGTNIKRNELESGEYFFQSKKQEVNHPGILSRYKRPFAPGFKYDGEYILNGNTTVVRVRILINQGTMLQEGVQAFGLKKSKAGFQIIPGTFSPFPEMKKQAVIL